jgi:hypothetical protein
MSRQQIVEDRSRHAAGRGAARGLERRPMAVVLALAGILGPVLFTAVFVIQELFRRGEYSPMAEPVSALEAGPGGWVQQVNFVGFGLLTIAFAVGLHRGMRPTRAGVAGRPSSCGPGWDWCWLRCSPYEKTPLVPPMTQPACTL